EWDGLFVSNEGAGNPDGAFYSFRPEQITWIGGDSSYNSRYGWNLDRLTLSFCSFGYCEQNLVKSARLGSGAIQNTLMFNMPGVNGSGGDFLTYVQVDTSKSDLLINPNSIFFGGKFVGTG